MKVLVLDTDESSRDALRCGFAAAGGTVRVFAGVPEGERALSELDPDVVVAALDPADADHAGVVRRLRASAPGRRRIVYALVDANDLERAVASGADDFFWRPVSAARIAQLAAAAAGAWERSAAAEETRLKLARVDVRGAL